MSFGKGGRGGGFGKGAGRGDAGGKGKGKGKGKGDYNDGPPASVDVVGTFMHECEGEMVAKLTNTMVPYFNAPIYLDKNSKIGKVDEIFGPINNIMFTIKTDPGINASSFQLDDKVSIAPDKLLPMSRFTGPQSGGGGGGGGKGKGKGKGGGKGGKGGGKGKGKGGGKGGGRGPSSPFSGRGGGKGGRGGRG